MKRHLCEARNTSVNEKFTSTLQEFGLLVYFTATGYLAVGNVGSIEENPQAPLREYLLLWLFNDKF